MLSKMGWKEGDGLGAKQQGIKDPLIMKRKRDMKGVGGSGKKDSSKNWDPWWESVMKEAYGAPAAADVDLFEACEGARCRPHGSAKLARIARTEERKGRNYYEKLLKENGIEIDTKMEKRLAKLERKKENESDDSDGGNEVREIEEKIEKKVKKTVERRRKRAEVEKY